jgi:hypothetical protein
MAFVVFKKLIHGLYKKYHKAAILRNKWWK